MISILVPVFNEEKIIENSVNEIKKFMNSLGKKWELIVVNDCSSDGTLENLIRAKKRLPNLKIISHEKNMGPGAGFRTGFKEAKGDIIITNDVDISFSFEYVPKMLAVLKDADVVIGSHHKRGSRMINVPLIRRVASTGASFLDRNALDVKISNMSSFFVAYKAKAIKGIDFKANGFDAQPEIIAKLYKKGFKIKDIACVLRWGSNSKRKSSLNLFREVRKRILLWRRLRKELKYTGRE